MSGEDSQSSKSPEDEIKDKLKAAKLDPSHWFDVFKSFATMPEQLDECDEDLYDDLKSHVRNKLEDKILKKFLGMVPKQKEEDTQETKVVPVREAMEKELQMNLKKADEILNKMEDLLKEGKCRDEEVVKQCEVDMQKVLEIPSDAWISEDKPLSELTTCLQAYIEILNESLKIKQDVPDSEVLSNASDGLALRGILISKNVKIRTEKREQLLRAPKDVQFIEPCQQPSENLDQLISKEKENHFSNTLERFGYKAASVKPCHVEVDTCSTMECIQQYCSTVKYLFIPMAAFQFEDTQLQLSVDAIADLKAIEKLIATASRNDIQRKCEEFFNKYGSHATKGMLHFGGSYQWHCSSKGFKISELSQVIALQEKVVDVSFQASKGPWSSSELDWPRIDARLTRQYSKALKDQIQLHVAKDWGTKESSEIYAWKMGLVSSNSNWNLIDCGMEMVPVWRIIQLNYRKEFSKKLVRVLVRAWERMTKLKAKSLLAEVLEFNEEDARDVVQKVNEWNQSKDASKCEENLQDLLKTKQKSPQVWHNQCLLSAPIQQYLNWIVHVNHGHRVETVKKLVSCLVEPSNTKHFPGKASIFKWLCQNEKSQLSLSTACNSFEEFIGIVQNALKELKGASPENTEGVQMQLTIYLAAVINNFSRQPKQMYDRLMLLTVLYPIGFDAKENFFECLLTTDDLSYLFEELGNQIKVFETVKSEGPHFRIQAYLFHLTVSFLNNRVDANFQDMLTNHFLYLQNEAKSIIDPKLKPLLKTLNPGFNWQKLQQNLLQEVMPTSAKGITESQFLDFLTMLHYHRLEPRNTQYMKVKDTNGVLDVLGLSQYYPQNLTRQAALCIYQQNLHDSKYLVVLEHLMMHNYQYWDCLCKDDGTFIVHPVDALLALLLCADNFLRQDLMSKMATCQLAIPLLLPDPFADTVTLPLWGMRSVVKEWKCEGTTVECCMVEHETPIVSFMRFSGSGLASTQTKSKILNTVIGDSQHNYFFHFDCEGGATKRVLMEGVVDLCWYLPAGKEDGLPQAVGFTNLRGNVQNHMLQFDFLKQISFMTFVLLTQQDLESEEKIMMLEELNETPGVLVLLFSDLAMEDEAQFNSELELQDCKIMKMKNRNLAFINREIRSLIVANLKSSSKQFKTLKGCSEIARQIGIQVDEDDPECCAGQQLAQNVMKEIDQVKPSNQVKDKLLPLQSKDLWHEWSQHNKEIHRRINKGEDTYDEYKDKMENKKDKIRKLQLEKSTPVMKMFISYLLQHKGNIRDYFLQWLKFLLDEHSQKTLPPLLSDYEQCKRNLQKAPDKSRGGTTENETLRAENETNEDETLRKELAKIKLELNAASLGLEHFFRELSQMYESVKEALQVMEDLRSKVSRLPALAAELLVAGYPLELMDGDASHVPMTWVMAVLDELHKLLGDAHLFVVSVLGIQSSGKSTLLNTMFGIRFAVSAGRCTRGAFIQLLRMQKGSGPSDYLLVVDTEGLRAPELDSQSMLKHDNEMATFVIGLADVTLINIKGETPSDIQDIMQTSVHAFIRMNEVEVKPSCQFVHQNVSSMSADTKLTQGKTNLVESLDKMVQYAAEQQQVETKYRVFNQVVSFDVEKDVWYFHSLWRGSPPMAPVNPSYCESSRMLKAALIQLASERKNSFNIKSFRMHINALWTAVLKENFVFSFKNMLETTVYGQLDSKLGQWSHELRSDILKLQITLENTVYSCDLGDLDDVKRNVTKMLNETVDKLQEDLLKKLEDFLKSSEHAEIMINWKAKTEIGLKHLCEKHRYQTEDYCNTLVDNRRDREKLDELHTHIYQRIQKPVRQLATKLKGQKLKDTALRKEFDKMWAEQIAPMKFRKLPTKDVERSIELYLEEMFRKAHESIIARKLSQCSLKSVPKKLQLNERHLTLSAWNKFKSMFKSSKEIFINYQSLMETATEVFVKSAKHHLDELCNKTKDYSATLSSKVLDKVKIEVNDYNSEQENFNFTEEYKMDLCIIVGGIALRKFEEMIKKKDPYTIMENLREPSFITFKNQVLQRRMEDRVAESLSLCLKDPVRTAVIDSLVPLLKDKVRLHDDRFHSKHGLLYNIMLNLKRRGDFKRYSLHLTSVKQSMHEWIKEYTIQYCTGKESNGQTRLERLAFAELEEKIKLLNSTAENITASNPVNIKNWIILFKNELASSFHLSLDELLERTDVSMIEGEDKPDYGYFKDEFSRELENVKKRLNLTFKDLHTEMKTWKRRPYDILTNDMIGCSKQCPFCKTKCEHINPDHPGDHRVSIHRPECLGGFGWKDSDIIVLDLCTESVESKNKFRTKQTDGEFVPYKKYRDIYKDWSIVPNSSRYNSSYWKYFVAHYTDEIATHFGRKKPPPGSDGDKTLQEWKKLEWDKVKEELKESFGL